MTIITSEPMQIITSEIECSYVRLWREYNKLTFLYCECFSERWCFNFRSLFHLLFRMEKNTEQKLFSTLKDGKNRDRNVSRVAFRIVRESKRAEKRDGVIGGISESRESISTTSHTMVSAVRDTDFAVRTSIDIYLRNVTIVRRTERSRIGNRECKTIKNKTRAFVSFKPTRVRSDDGRRSGCSE